MNMSNDVQLLMSQAPELLLKLAAIIIIGGLLGFERQQRGKSVGILTAILVAMGSMIFVHAGLLIIEQSGASGDSTRIASMIASGIGFIGAGAIMRSKFSVTGLASAATIWNLGGLGILIGLGYVFFGLVVAVLVFLLLRFIPRLEHRLFNRRFCLHVEVEVETDKLSSVLAFLVEQQVTFSPSDIRRNGDRSFISINECGMESRTGIVDSFRHVDGVINILDHHQKI